MNAPAPQCDACRRFGPGKTPHSCDIKHGLRAEPGGPDHKASHGFEKRSAAKAECRYRAGALRRQAAQPDRWSRRLGIDSKALLALADDLDSRIQSLAVDGSPACPTEKRAYRRRLLSSVILYARGFTPGSIRTFTLLNSAWRVPAEDLLEFKPGRVLGQFRQHLNRSGVGAIPGFLIAFLDCEFESVGQVFVFHLQGIGTETKVEALRGLKEKPRWGYEKSPTGSAPLVVKRVADLARQASYLDKAFSVAKGVREIDGVVKRDRRGQRIPEPFHALFLLWMSRQRNADLRVLSSCRLLPCGHVRRA